MDNTFGWGILDSNEELVMVVGLLALSWGSGVDVLEGIFGWVVLDSSDDEFGEDVIGIWVVLDIVVDWLVVVVLEDIFGWVVLVNIDGSISVGIFLDCPNAVLGKVIMVRDDDDNVINP